MPSGSATFCKAEKWRSEFRLGRVDRSKRRAGEFELTAGLKRNGGLGGFVIKADDLTVLEDRRRAGFGLHPFEEGPNAVMSGATEIRNRGVVHLVEGEFFVLGPDPELIRRFGARFEPSYEPVARRDGRGIQNVAGHIQNFRGFVGERPSAASLRPGFRPKAQMAIDSLGTLSLPPNRRAAASGVRRMPK